jgi:hypothetical protein
MHPKDLTRARQVQRELDCLTGAYLRSLVASPKDAREPLLMRAAELRVAASRATLTDEQRERLEEVCDGLAGAA